MKKQLLTGAFLLTALFAAKAQDSCATALPLSTGTTTVGEIDGEYDDTCWGTPATAGEWYVITAPADGAYRINTNLTANAGGDTRISVYSGTCDALECWDGSDDVNPAQTGGNYLTNWQFPVVGGNTYYVVFDDRWSADGFDVEVTFSEAECATNSLTEDWSDISSYYFCWTTEDGDADENTWSLSSAYNWDATEGNDNVVLIFSGAEAANDDYLVSSTKNLVAGTEYTVNVVYNGINTQDAEGNVTPAEQSFDVFVAQEESYTVIGSEDGVVMDGTSLVLAKTNASTGTYTFTPEADGAYVFGINSTSEANSGALVVFEINVEGTMSTPVAALNNFTVSPNPANSIVTVSNADNMLINSIQLTDVNGRVVKAASFEGAAQAQVNVSDLANGVYMMNIASDKGSVTKKIVKN